MVRLKGGGLREGDIPNATFQFLNGTIKRIVAPYGAIRIGTFQFLNGTIKSRSKNSLFGSI